MGKEQNRLKQLENENRNLNDRLKSSTQKAEKLQKSFDYLPDPVIEINNKDEKILYFNVAAKSLGLDNFNDIGKKIGMVFPAKTAEKILNSVKKTTVDPQSSSIRIINNGLEKTYFCIPLSVENSTSIILFREDLKSRVDKNELPEFRTVVDQSPLAIVITDLESHIEYVNPKFTELTGYSSEEIMGQKINFLKSDGCPAELYEELWRTITSGRVWNGVFENKRKNGEIYWEQAIIGPLFNEEGNKSKYIKIAEDISESVLIEKALDKSESLLKETQRLTHIGNWSHDLVKSQIIWSEESFNILGVRPQKVTKELVLSLIHPDDKDILTQAFRESEKGINPIIIDFRVIRPDGSTRYIHNRWISKYDSDGKEIFRVGTHQDVTEQKVAEIKIKENEERLRALINSTPDIICFKDEEGRWLEANDADLELFSLGGVDYFGKTDAELADFTHPLYKDAFLNCMVTDEKAWKAGGISKGEEKIPTIDGGYKVFDVIKVPLFEKDGSRKGLVVLGRDFTDRVKAEEALRNSEEKFRKIFENTALGIIITDWNTGIRQNNSAFQALIGYSHDELSSRDFLSLIHHSDREKTKKEIQNVKSDVVSSVELENRFIHKNGEVIWVRQFLSALDINSKSNNNLVSILKDITDNVYLEKMQAARLRLIDYSINHDTSEVLQRFLDEAESLTESEIGFYHFLEENQKIIFLQTWSTNTLRQNCKLKDDDRRYPVEKAGVWVDCIKTGKPVIHNNYKKLKNKKGMPDGHVPITRELVVPVKRQNKILAILGVGNKKSNYVERDVNIVRQLADLAWETIERKRAEELLRDNENRYRILVDSSNDAIFFYLPGEGFVEVNRVACKRLGYTKDEFRKMHPQDVNTPEFAETVQHRIDALMKDGKLLHESTHVARDGTMIPVEVSSKVIDYKGKKAILAFSRDITERKKAEQELTEYREHLEKLVKERTSELEAFTYSVSHDLRAPLRAIDGFSKFIENDYSSQLDEEGKRYIDVIRQNTKKMDRLITDLLKLSRLSRGNPEFVNLNMKALARSMYQEVATPAEKDQFDIFIEDIPDANGDATTIKQVWINLISNALKYSSKSRVKKIEIGCREDKKVNVYYVKDYGIGFDPQYKRKLFNVFQRLHKETDYKGSGIGLAIVKMIIGKHKGTVWAESEPDKGAAFYFTLPKS